MVKLILIIILTSIKKFWTCKSQNGEVRHSSVSHNPFERSKDYGFYLGDFTEETVMNGNETVPHQYPWMVSVCGKFYLDSSGGMICTESCGGTLIHRQYVLTAAHCVAGGTIDDTFVVTGAHNVNKKFQKFDWSVLIDIVLHPEYDATKQKEYKRSPDVAILKLEESVEFGPKVNAISLPDFFQVNKDYENEYAVVAGWGVKDYDKKNTPITSEDKLMEASVKIRSNSWCKKRANLHFIESFHLCTYPDNPHLDPSSTCKGDSGGPLMVKDEENGGRWIEIAISSFRVNTGRCGHTEAGFTKITYSVLSWIKSILQGPSVVISSTSRMVDPDGGILGQYEYLEDQGYYVQSSTEQSNERFEVAYLYPDEDDNWWVGDVPGEKKGWLRNPQPSKTPPTTGWQYKDHDKDRWEDDLTLTVSPGPLPPLPRTFNVTASGPTLWRWSSHMGVYTRTERWFNGRPVYVNTEGNLLYQGFRDGWLFGDELGWAAWWGSRTRHSPADEDSWTWGDFNHLGGDVTVTASD